MRKKAKIIDLALSKLNDNPVVQKLDDRLPEKVTQHDNVVELHRILVQTCVDYIQKHNLSDIYAVHFNVFDIQPSVELGEWDSATDSSFSVEGTAFERDLRADGTVRETPYRVKLDESY